MIEYMREYGAVLAANGYSVIPIGYKSKKPIDEKWSDIPPYTVEQCKRYPYPACGVSIINGRGDHPVCVLDLDSDDPEVSEAFLRTLDRRRTIERTGKPNRKAIFFQAPGIDWSYSGTGKLEKEVDGKVVEVLLEFRKSGHTVLYGVHPDTGKEYKWDKESEGLDLLHFKPEELPVLTNEDVERMKIRFIQIAKSYGFSKAGKDNESDEEPNDIDDGSWSDVSPGLSQLTIEQAREYLNGSGIDPESYDSWLRAGMALHNHFKGDYEALKLWDEWSSKANSYTGFEDCEKKWISFKEDRDRRITIGSIIASYKRNHRNFDAKVYVRTLAEKMYKLFKDEIKKRDSANSNWYLFNGKHWDTASLDQVIAKLLPYIEQEFIDYIDETTIPEQRRSREKFYLAYLKSPVRYIRETVSVFSWLHASILVNPDSFDSDFRYFGIANGDVDLETGSFLEPDASRMISKSSSVVFDAKADCPLWKKTLEECLVREEVVEYFQRFVGYTALGNPKENKIAFLHGFGCNGKSTIMSVLLEVFGSYGIAMQPETLVTLSEKRSSSATGLSPDVVRLKGARLALAEELTEGAKIKSEMLKRLAGNEKITAREMYQSPIEFQPTHTVFVCTNHLPKVADDSDGTWRRIVLIEFPRSFDRDPNFKKDENLKEKLLKEASGILNWIFEGVRRYRQFGLALPKSMDMAAKKWRGEEDVVGSWAEECLEGTAPDEKTPMREVYAAFKLWAAECGVEKQSSQWLTRRLKERGYCVKMTPKKINYLFGARVKSEEESWEW
ncbi:phage/plasmid primase, P4 family [uncultured Parasutterella sp.]|uniref:phage/plasmid primase, P4 family n=1 Tax=uncultured Parasutterella sp. TaxID=1263098 RepID=UPI00272C6455|nr:phage/plasmid primase, P4 family [uncultured Parasutterella sp.]